MQIRQGIFKHTAMQVLYFFLEKICKVFWHITAFLPLNIAKFSTFKNGPFFWPTLYIIIIITTIIITRWTWYGMVWYGSK